MQIQILNKKLIERLAENPFSKTTALVSITDYSNDFAELKNRPEFLLQVAFDDVDNDVIMDELGNHPTNEEIQMVEKKYHMLSEEQACQIAEFYYSVSKTVDCFICQCEHGQSRSAAVAAAILEHKSRKGIRIFADDRYYPNKVIFRKVLNALNKVHQDL